MRRRLFALLLALFVPLAVAAQTTPATPPLRTEDLHGTWTTVKDVLFNEITYSADGTFRGRISHTVTKATIWDYAGTWHFADGLLQYNYTESKPEHVPVGFVDQDRILEIHPEWLRLRSSNNKELTYKRVRK